MPFDQPHIPNIDNILSQAGRGYGLGTAMREQHTLAKAGERFQQGDQAGTVNALAEGGQLDKAMEFRKEFEAAAGRAETAKLEKANRFNTVLGNLALSVKNLPQNEQPHAWANAVTQARKVGLQVGEEFDDFGMLDVVLARAGETKTAIDQEMARRKAQGGQFKVVGKGGRIFDEQTQQWIEPPGGTDALAGAGKLSPGERWRMKNEQLDLDASGRPIAEPIPGSSKEAVSAETASRIGLADKFLEDAPSIRKSVKEGELGTTFGFKTDLGVNLDFLFGSRGAGELYRRFEDGSEALVRNLTGAGMNKEEAESYARRFLPDYTDTRETTLSKLDNLEKNLQAVINRVETGRGRAGIDAPKTGADKNRFRFNPETGELE